MKDFVKFIVVLMILALALGLVYSILSPILGEFFPEETKDKNVSTETQEPPETEVVEPEETEPGHFHDYGEYVVVTEATCSNKGLEKATCKGCAGYITRETAKLAHTYDKGKITTEPTCAKTGVKTYTCSVCGNQKSEMLSKLTTHNYVNGKCSVCGATDGEEVYCSECDLSLGECQCICSTCNLQLYYCVCDTETCDRCNELIGDCICYENCIGCGNYNYACECCSDCGRYPCECCPLCGEVHDGDDTC